MSTFGSRMLEDDSEWGAQVWDAKFYGSCFTNIQFVHVSRDTNCVAHKLARYARTIEFELIWIEKGLVLSGQLSQSEACSCLNLKRSIFWLIIVLHRCCFFCFIMAYCFRLGPYDYTGFANFPLLWNCIFLMKKKTIKYILSPKNWNE